MRRQVVKPYLNAAGELPEQMRVRHEKRDRLLAALGAEIALGVQVAPVAGVQHLGRALTGRKQGTAVNGPHRHVQPHARLGHGLKLAQRDGRRLHALAAHRLGQMQID